MNAQHCGDERELECDGCASTCRVAGAVQLVRCGWCGATALLRLVLESGSMGQMRHASSGHWRSVALCVKKIVGRPRVSTMAMSRLRCLNQYCLVPRIGCQHSAALGLKRLLLHNQPCHGAFPLRAGHLEGAVEHKSGLSEEHVIASRC